MTDPAALYAQQIRSEGDHWHNESLELLRQGVIPYSADFRLHLTQLVARRGGLPFHLGAGLIPTRFREVANVLAGAAGRIHAGGRDVLDLGCGAGWLSLELARQGGRVLGLDVSRDNLAMAEFFAARDARSRPHLYPRFAGLPLREMGTVSFQFGDLNREISHVPSESADVVAVWDSLHHVRDLSVTFREVARVLRPGGFFIGHDFVGPSADAEIVRAPLLETMREVMRRVSAPELEGLRRHAVATSRGLPLRENAVDDTTRVSAASEAYLAETLTAARQRFVEGRTPASVASPFEEVSVGYLLSELREAFDVPQFYSMGAFWPEDMPPPPPDRDDAGGLLFHYLSFLSLAMDDLVVDAGAPGRYVCFVAVPRGREAAMVPKLGRTAEGLLGRREDPETPAEASTEGLRAELRLLLAENRALRHVLAHPPGPAADAHRFYFKVVRPLIRRLLLRR